MMTANPLLSGATVTVGLEDKYKLLASGREPMAVLQGVAAGITLEVIAQAVNVNAQSVASDPILVAMPAAEVRSLATETAKLEAAGMILPEAPSGSNGVPVPGNGSALLAAPASGRFKSG